MSGEEFEKSGESLGDTTGQASEPDGLHQEFSKASSSDLAAATRQSSQDLTSKGFGDLQLKGDSFLKTTAWLDNAGAGSEYKADAGLTAAVQSSISRNVQKLNAHV